MKQVLIIDDDKELCALMKKCIEQENLSAVTAYSGIEGLQIIKENQNNNGFSLIILDVMMPYMDGFQVLKKIREDAYGYFHGHEVGGTNPSLLEALGSTQLNLLLDVGFNREVAEDGAMYWSKDNGSLSSIISSADQMTVEQLNQFEEKAKKCIIERYTWENIRDKYERVFLISE